MKRSKQSVPGVQTGENGREGGSQGINWPEATPRNPNVGTSAKGQLAPRPKNSKAAFLGSSQHTAGAVASMARVPNAGGANAHPNGSFGTPLAGNAMANLKNLPNPAQSDFQASPNNLRAGARGRNYPNGPMANQAGGPSGKPNSKHKAFYGA